VDITRSTIPGIGHSHDCRTRDGQRSGVLVEHTGRRRLLTYGSGDGDDGDACDDGRATEQILMDADEADQLADLLHQRSVADRLAELERRVAELARTPAPRQIDA
jgi:TrkA domain protein